MMVVLVMGVEVEVEDVIFERGKRMVLRIFKYRIVIVFIVLYFWFGEFIFRLNVLLIVNI